MKQYYLQLKCATYTFQSGYTICGTTSSKSA